MSRFATLLTLLALGCAQPPADPIDDDTPDPDPPLLHDSGSTPVELDDWVDGLQGAWSGSADGTPLGDLPFAMTFTPDGETMVGEAALPGFSLVFWFEPTDDGWRFIERGTMAGNVQEYTLAPTARDGTQVTWTHDDPEFLTVDATVDDDHLLFDVALRGDRHVLLDLSRDR